MSSARQARAVPRLRRYAPILDWLPKYDRSRLRADLLAGSVVAALAVPQSLGYAAIAGVPVQLGLYAVPVALIAYAIFGTSRQLVIGPVSTVSVMSGSLVVALHPVDLAQAIAFTTAAAMWAGVFLLIAAQLRIGWVAEFLSKPIVTGFVLGLTLLVILGELPNLLGIPVGRRDVVGRILELIGGFSEDPRTLALSVAALVMLFVGSWLLPQVPWSLVVLVLGLLGSRVLHLAERGVAVVGTVPAGLPRPQIPSVPLDRMLDVAAAGAALAFVGLAEGLSAARLFAVRRDYRLHTDQELLAAGASNLATGIMGGLAVAGSLSKTAAVDRAGGRSQVAGLAAAVLAILAIVFFAPALGLLPKAVLSAIIVHAVWGLIDIPAMRRYRRSRRLDFVAASVAVIAVLIAGPLLGLLVAIGWSILGLVYRSSRATIDVMGRVPGEKAAWGALEKHPERFTQPGVLVLRINESLFWVNAARVKDRVLDLVDEHPDVKALVLDLESSDQLEITSVDMLTMLLDRLRAHGIDVYLVRVRRRVRRVLENTGMREKLGEDHLWRSISQGVRAAQHHHDLTPVKPPPAPVVAPTTADDAGEEEDVLAHDVLPEEEDDSAVHSGAEARAPRAFDGEDDVDADTQEIVLSRSVDEDPELDRLDESRTITKHSAEPEKSDQQAKHTRKKQDKRH
ncbi:MAG: SulP family inorganic anion transporter [Micrococcales bacterium]|nr:SulP family inorganic anion transporter [Micrococcales bacterium]